MSISISQTTVSLLGIATNSLLINCVIFHTPKIVKTYSTIILIHTISDAFCCLIVILSKPRIIVIGLQFFYPSNGLCSLLGTSACGISDALIAHSFSYSLYLLLVSFLYRYLVLKNVKLNVKQLLCICFGVYVPCFLEVIFVQFATESGDHLYNIIHAKYPQYNMTGYVYNALTDLKTPYSIIGYGHICVSPTMIYLVIMYLRKSIVKSMQVTTSNMSKNTRNMHDQLLKSLIIQSMIPQVSIIGLVIVCVEIFDIYADAMLEESVFLCLALVPGTTPIISLIFIKPYNFRVRRLLRLKIRAGDEAGYASTDRRTIMNVSTAVPEFKI